MNTRRFSLTHITPDHIAGAISYLHRTGQSCMSRELDGLPLRAGSIAFLLHLYTERVNIRMSLHGLSGMTKQRLPGHTRPLNRVGWCGVFATKRTVEGPGCI